MNISLNWLSMSVQINKRTNDEMQTGATLAHVDFQSYLFNNLKQQDRLCIILIWLIGKNIYSGRSIYPGKTIIFCIAFFFLSEMCTYIFANWVTILPMSSLPCSLFDKSGKLYWKANTWFSKGFRGRRIVVGFLITYAISAYHH